MKAFSFLLPMFLLCKCNLITSSSLSSFIPGTYIREVANEYSLGKDTLIICRLSSTVYVVTYCNNFQRIEEGRFLPRERKVEKWAALFDREAGILKETKRGRILSFQPHSNTLHLSGSVYKKII